MKKTIRSFIDENYLLCWKFIKESRRFIYAITSVFFGFAIIGFLVPVPDYISQEIMKIIAELVKKTEGMSQTELIQFIFLNNAQSGLLGMALGIFLGIFPIIFSAFNGYILGFVALAAVDAGGSGVLWKILPHGIFELPAIFISLGLGLRMGLLIFQHSTLKKFKYSLYELARVFVFVVLPLLIIAAIIEGSLIALTQ